MSRLLDDVRRLAEVARRSLGEGPGGTAVDEIVARLDEPLRVAFAGRVKAGKSTLLNALVGEQLAPTDAGECTRIVTWYRDGHSPRVVLHLHDGRTRQASFTRADGTLTVDLGNEVAEGVERIDVQWPSSRLAGVTLIDTPGLGSATEGGSAPTTRFLAIDDDADGPGEADAVIYLMRHLHQSDLGIPRGLPRRVGDLGQPGEHDRRAVAGRRGGRLPPGGDADGASHRRPVPQRTAGATAEPDRRARVRAARRRGDDVDGGGVPGTGIHRRDARAPTPRRCC